MTKKATILLLVLLIFNFILPQGASAIGQMTKPIIVKDALRGQAIESVLTLYNSEDKEITYQLVADGKIKSWTSFYSSNDLKNPIDEIKVPAKSNIKAVARFTVPKDAANGEYAGEVAIVSAPEKGVNAGVNVSVGMRIGRQVSITVTDKEIIKFDASVIPNKYDFGKNELLSIRVIYDNQGNIVIDPSIQLKIKKDGQTISNAIYPYPENQPPVAPLARVEIQAIEVPTASLSQGGYSAEIIISQGGAEILKKDFRFSVGTLNSGAMAGLAGGFDPKNISLPLIISLILAGVIGAAAIYAYKNRLQRIRENTENPVKTDEPPNFD